MSFFELVNPHAKTHRGARAGWLRAAVLGANDGLVSTASLMVGVAASGAAAAAVLTAGVAGLAAGSMAMAAGEYVPVSSQVDVERADRAKEERELAADPEAELAWSWRASTASAACPSHWLSRLPRRCTMRTRWGPISAMSLDTSDITTARPLQAAAASAASFFIGGLLPLLGLVAPTATARLWLIVAVTLIGLAVTGILSAWIAGTALGRPRAAGRHRRRPCDGGHRPRRSTPSCLRHLTPRTRQQ